MVALWGLMEDPPLAAVQRGLREANIGTIHIDQRKIPGASCEFVMEGARITGTIRSLNSVLDIEEVEAIYLRPYDFSQLEDFAEIDRSSEEWAKAVRFEDAISLWCDMAGGIVVNRPSAMDSNNSKPYQLTIIGDAGFAIPETIITTEPDAVVAFWEEHQQIIYKSVSSRRSIVTRLKASDLDRIGEVASCPTQFQRFIAGTDYRIHVLGSQIFASKVISSGDDYRYSSDTITAPVVIPEDIAGKCVSLTNKLGLLFSGIDLRQTPDGGWFCFEANPCPGYTSFEDQAPQVTKALVQLLTSQSKPGRPPLS